MMSTATANPLVQEGTLLVSRYEVQKILGEGNFGCVTRCLDTATNTKVAIKIVKEEAHALDLVAEEIEILEELSTMNPERCGIVRWHDWFWNDNLICLKFELLDMNLIEYMTERNFKSLAMAEIRSMLLQLNSALQLLSHMRIIHGDIKPQNIMVVDRTQQPLQVKLIDFGLACHVPHSVTGLYVQHLWYRAPEVILGFVCDEQIDMWSLGLLTAELALGCPIFPGMHEYDVIKFVVDTLGQPPDYQLQFAEKSTTYFNNVDETWTLKTPEEFAALTGHCYKDARCYSSAEELEEIFYLVHRAEKNETHLFVDLLKQMLQVDKYKRMHPFNLPQHPLFSFEPHTDSSSNTNMNNLTTNLDAPNVIPSLHEKPGLIGPESISGEEATIIQPGFEVKTEEPIIIEQHHPSSQVKCVSPKATSPETNNNTVEGVRRRSNRKRTLCCSEGKEANEWRVGLEPTFNKENRKKEDERFVVVM